MAEDKKGGEWLPGGEPIPDTDQPVSPHHPLDPPGSRQDGAGAAPPRAERTDGTPVGTLAQQRGGVHQGTGESDDPFRAHRGEPATFRSGEAEGSGAGAGGGGAGASEDPDPDDRGGGGRSDPAGG